MSKKKALLWAALLLAGLRLAAAPQSLLPIAVEDDAGPWSFKDGTGYANDVVKAAFEASGVAIDLQVLPYARCKEMAADGRMPACFSMSWLPELKDTFAFSKKPLFQCYADYFFSDKSKIHAQRARDFPRGTVLGVVIGYEYPASVYALRKSGVLVFEESDSELLNLEKLAAGRVDAALINWNEVKTVDSLLAKAGAMGLVRRGPRAGILESYIGFSLRHPKGAWAKKKFDRGFAKIEANGRLKAIQAKWKAPAE